MSPAAAVREIVRGGYARRDLVLAAAAGRVPRALARRHRLRQMSPYAAAEVRAATADLESPDGASAAQGSPLARELLRQTFHTSLPVLLRYADRDSMAHSREVRLPFLDRRVAEFALSLPTTFLYRQGVTKSVLREAMRGLVPDQILDRRDKVGFEPPQASWLGSARGIALARDVLLDPGARARPFYDLPAIERDVRAGSWRDHSAIWRAISVELWLAGCARSPERPAAVAA
jgi:asparagine synthase (glutamine-hydrolysing)